MFNNRVKNHSVLKNESICLWPALLLFPGSLGSLLRIPGFHRAQFKILCPLSSWPSKNRGGHTSILQAAVAVSYIRVKGTGFHYRCSEPELRLPEGPCRLINSCSKRVNNEFVQLEGKRESISGDGVTSILKTARAWACACVSPYRCNGFIYIHELWPPNPSSSFFHHNRKRQKKSEEQQER